MTNIRYASALMAQSLKVLSLELVEAHVCANLKFSNLARLWFLDGGHALDSQSPHCKSHRENKRQIQTEEGGHSHFPKETEVEIISSEYFERHPGRLVMTEQKVIAALMFWYFPLLAKSQSWRIIHIQEMFQNPAKTYLLLFWDCCS